MNKNEPFLRENSFELWQAPGSILLLTIYNV